MKESLGQIGLDREQLGLDRRRAIATLDGEELAQTLTSIAEKDAGLTRREETIRAALAKFAEDVAHARTQARAALVGHLSVAVGLMGKELAERKAAAHARLLSAIATAADEVAALDGVESLITQTSMPLRMHAAGYEADFMGAIAKALAGDGAVVAAAG